MKSTLVSAVFALALLAPVVSYATEEIVEPEPEPEPVPVVEQSHSTVQRRICYFFQATGLGTCPNQPWMLEAWSNKDLRSSILQLWWMQRHQ